MNGKKIAAAVTIAGATSLGFAAPASAQPPIAVGNLVNVQVTNVDIDVVRDVNVAVAAAANIVAQVCSDITVPVALLAVQGVVDEGGEFTCDSETGDQTVTVTQA